MPRRVGDGGEYFVMALQLAKMRPPSLSRDELQDMKRDLAQYGAGFESSLLEYPGLVGTNGRQDFLHFFLYPLIVAPWVPLVSAIGLHPNWAFTWVNAVLLAGAVFLVVRNAPLLACVAGFLSPIVWWVDKAHTEAFLFATVSVAAVLFRHRPSLAVIAFALAGAQNAALGITYPVFVGLLWLATRSTTFTRRTWVAVAGGAALVASPFAYTWVRLGRLSPMAEYAQRALPSPGGIAGFIVEPNIGLLPNAPAFGFALALAGWYLLRTLKGKSQPSFWWWPVVIQLMLLAVWSQNPNANHGGTPGVNRWVLSLLALSLPWLSEARQLPGSGARVALNIGVAVVAVMTAAAHGPARAENYREPTALAVRMWNAGLVHATLAEVFVERTQGREPAVAPAHDGTCGVLLIADQQSPVQCPPPVEPLPSSCRRPGAMCYAIVEPHGARYVTAPNNGFFYNVAQTSWPAGGPLAAGVNRVLREADPGARAWRLDNPRRWRELFPGAEIGAVLRGSDVIVIHITRASEEARQAIAANASYRLDELIPSAQLTNLAVTIRRTGR
jgi:hypothetical protein